jgi:hypothetical protein
MTRSPAIYSLSGVASFSTGWVVIRCSPFVVDDVLVSQLGKIPATPRGTVEGEQYGSGEQVEEPAERMRRCRGSYLRLQIVPAVRMMALSLRQSSRAVEAIVEVSVHVLSLMTQYGSQGRAVGGKRR